MDNSGDLAHGNIGNYKGVMLCNRPNEPGEPVFKERFNLDYYNTFIIDKDHRHLCRELKIEIR